MQKLTQTKPVGILIDKLFNSHLTPPYHSESSKRIDAIIKVVDTMEYEFLRVSPKAIDPADLLTTHTQEHISFIEKRCASAKLNRPVMIDSDTWVSSESFNVALNAIGGIYSLADASINKEIQYSFAFVRPPGHHALSYTSMGFCLFNNVALLANYLLKNYNLSKIAIIDFDAHHGNGTQQIFFNSKNVLTLSLHQYPFWPNNSGWISEVSTEDFAGYNINLPMVAGSNIHDYNRALNEIIIPVLNQFEPEFIIFAAGFDAHKEDTISELQLDSQFYGYFIDSIIQLNNSIPAIAVLEGGYNLSVLKESITYSLKALAQKKATEQSVAYIDASDNFINENYFLNAKDFIGRYWSFS